jgi:RecB family exonuclease
VRWFVDQFGGGSSSFAAGLGTVIHAVMETAVSSDAEQLWAGVEQRWNELSFEAPWIEARQRRAARDLVESLSQYLGDAERAGTTLLGAESRFSLSLGPAVLTGSIDRVEHYADGSVVIVDLKTGRSEATTDSGVAEHPQLSSYQLAYAEGVVPGIPDDAIPGGAKLVLVAIPRAGKLYAAPTQAAFTPEQLDAFREHVIEVAVRMAGPVYQAPRIPPQFARVARPDIQTLGAVSE